MNNKPKCVVDYKPICAVYIRIAKEPDEVKEPVTALYCRTVQACEFEIAEQVAMLREYAKENGHGNIAVYSDNGFNGANLNRPALQRLKADVDAGLVGVLLVKDMSRISRNFLDVPAFLDGVKRKSVKIRFVMDGFGYDEPPIGIADLRSAMYKPLR